MKGIQSDQIQLSIFYRPDLVQSMSFGKVGKLYVDRLLELLTITKSIKYFNFHPITLETCVCITNDAYKLSHTQVFLQLFGHRK